MKNRIELSVRELALFSLKKWWIILLCVLIFGILYTGYSQKQHHVEVQKIQSNFEESMAEYEKNVEKNRSLLSISIRKRDELNEYLKKSIIMRVSPQRVQQSIRNISVVLDPPAYVNTRIVVDHYMAYVKDIDYQALLADSDLTNIENRYLDEMVTVARGQSDLLSITVKGDEETDTAYFAEAIYEFLLSKKEEVQNNTDVEHELKIFSISDRFIVDPTIKNLQAVDQRSLTTLQTEIKNLQVDKPSNPIVADYSFIKSLIIGGLMGLSIGLLLCCSLYTILLPMQYTQQLRGQLGIPFLGNLRPINKRTRLVDGYSTIQSEEQSLQYATASLIEASNGAKRVLLTGTVAGAKIQELADEISAGLSSDGIHITVGANVLCDSNTVNELSQADAVVFVESIDTSKVRHVNLQKERIQQSNKPILGYFVV